MRASRESQVLLLVIVLAAVAATFTRRPPPALVPTAIPAPSATGQTTNQKDGSVLVYVPAGTFTMGSNDGDSDEKPPHSVTLAPYCIGKVTVTNAQFRRFVSASGYDAGGDWQRDASKWGDDCPDVDVPWHDLYGQRDAKWGDDCPVVDVSWHDANAYCRWAGLRLPTEAEWEYAARGRHGRRYPWGDRFDASRCRSSVAPGSVGQPAPVGSYPEGASWCGCLDMAGNVWQW